MHGFTPRLPWYKTSAGKIFLAFLALLALGLLFFGSLVGYYTYQILQGNALDIEQSIRSSRFTLGTNLNENQEEIVLNDPSVLIREHTPMRGPEDAAISVVMFIDFECPFCRQSYSVFEDVSEKYEPVLRVIYKHFPLTAIHPLSVRAGEAAQCAHDQGKFWNYHEIIFRKQNLSQTSLTTYAGELGLDVDAFTRCMQSNIHEPHLNTDFQDGVDIGVRGTPTYFVNGRKVEGVISREEWDTILLQALDQ